MVPAEDEDVSKELLRLFGAGIDVNLSVKDTKIEKNKTSLVPSSTQTARLRPNKRRRRWWLLARAAHPCGVRKSRSR
jgi:hypothetical protein